MGLRMLLAMIALLSLSLPPLGFAEGLQSRLPSLSVPIPAEITHHRVLLDWVYKRVGLTLVEQYPECSRLWVYRRVLDRKGTVAIIARCVAVGRTVI